MFTPELRPALYISILACGTLSGAEPRFEFDITLHDESRLIGTVEGTELKVRTQFGDHSIPFKVLKRLEFEKKEKHFTFLLRNDDLMAGQPKDASVVLNSTIGELSIPYAKVATIDISPPVRAAALALTDGLEVYFDFDREEGAEVANKTTRTPSGNLVEGTRKEHAIVLDGKGDHVALANHKVFENTDTFTISLWSKLHSFAPGGYANEHGYLVNKGNDMWWNPAWSLGYSKRSGAGKGVTPGPNPALFTIGTEQTGGLTKCRVSSMTELKTGTWYHLVATYDGKAAKLYLDGKLEGETAYTGKLRRDAAPLLLGGGKLGGTGFGNHFTTDATIDNFRFYSRALSAGEVRLLHQHEARQPEPAR